MNNDNENHYIGNRGVFQDQTKQEWKDDAAEHVRTTLFWKKPFVKDEELQFGSNIQQLICIHLHINSENTASKFWNVWGGREEVRMAFRRKRQVVSMAVKKAFFGT